MKLCLVHSPCVWPTTIPLGVACLKGYLGRVQPDVEVRILDLNHRFFQTAAERLPGLCQYCPRRNDPTCAPPELFFAGGNLSQAEKLFRDPERFFDKERYAESFVFYNAYYRQVLRCIDTVLMSVLANANPSAEQAVRRLLEPDLEAILAESPDLIGFSASTMQIAWSMTLAEMVARETSIPIVLGGYFVSVYDAVEVMQTHPAIDYIVYKEGELGLAGLVESLPGAELDEVPNLVYRKNGEIIVNPERWVDDLSEIPYPDFSDFAIGDYLSPYPVLPILSSRGCHWGRCAFCEDGPNYAKKYRIRSPESVVDEMQLRAETDGVRYFLFCDQTIPAKSLERLAAAITARGLDVRYGFSGFRASRKVTPEILEKAYASGCRWLYFGVETLTQRLLDAMGKGTEVDHVLDVIRWCRELGITPYVSYFWGFPTQTADEVKEEARACMRNRDFFSVPDDGGVFYLAKGSDVYRHPEKYDVEAIADRISFATETGKITSVAPTYRAKKGLTGAEAKALFQHEAGENLPYETGGFWSHLVILGDRRVDLIFPREYHRTRLAQPLRPYAEHVAEHGDSLLDGEERGPQVAKLRYQLACAHSQAGRHEAAREQYQRTVEAFPDSPVVHRALAETLFRLGAYEEAIAPARRVIELGTKELAAYSLLASCLERAERFDEALQVYQSALQTFPKQAALFRQVARLRRLAAKPKGGAKTAPDPTEDAG